MTMIGSLTSNSPRLVRGTRTDDIVNALALFLVDAFDIAVITGDDSEPHLDFCCSDVDGVNMRRFSDEAIHRDADKLGLNFDVPEDYVAACMRLRARHYEEGAGEDEIIEFAPENLFNVLHPFLAEPMIIQFAGFESTRYPLHAWEWLYDPKTRAIEEHHLNGIARHTTPVKDALTILRDLRDKITRFERECQAEEYTDTDDAWDLLHEIDRQIVEATSIFVNTR